MSSGPASSLVLPTLLRPILSQVRRSSHKNANFHPTLKISMKIMMLWRDKKIIEDKTFFLLMPLSNPLDRFIMRFWQISYSMVYNGFFRYLAEKIVVQTDAGFPSFLAPNRCSKKLLTCHEINTIFHINIPRILEISLNCK